MRTTSAFASVLLAPALAAATPGPGCDPSRPAVAHYAGGAVLDPQPANGPIACGVYTGFPGGETRIETGSCGTLMYAPAAWMGDEPQTTFYSRGGLAISEDDGASWHLSLPLNVTWHDNDLETYVDRETGKLFFGAMFADPPGQVPTDAQGNPVPLALSSSIDAITRSHILSTPDEGESWTYSEACCEIVNGAGIVAADPVLSTPIGYPNAVYYTWHASQTVPGRPPEGIVQRSLDGGATFEIRGWTHRPGVPVHPECPSPSSTTATPDENSETGGLPVPTADGKLWVVIACGGQAYLAASSDEGATWPIVRTLPHVGELRIDEADNFYLMRSTDVTHTSGTLEDHTHLWLSVSGDRGASWSPELDVRAPAVVSFEAERTALFGGVSCCTNWFYDVREPGHVAVAYSGRTAVQGTTLDGYITETRNALDILHGGQPVFWSAFVNSPSQPLKFETGHPVGANGSTYPTPVGSALGGPQANQVGMDLGPDGSPWASFLEDCGPSPDAQGCIDQHGQTRGFAGRLDWPCVAGDPWDRECDGAINSCDVCPFASDPDQRDTGGIATATPDGIGNACQCGDVTGNGVVNGQDAQAIKRYAIGLPSPTFVVPGNCDVNGNGVCNGQDANAVQRIALGLPSPTFGQHCPNADPTTPCPYCH
jgi:hypothetical protein